WRTESNTMPWKYAVGGASSCVQVLPCSFHPCVTGFGFAPPISRTSPVGSKHAIAAKFRWGGEPVVYSIHHDACAARLPANRTRTRERWGRMVAAGDRD